MARKTTHRDEPGRYAYEGLDRVLHEKARLGIMTTLVTKPEGAVFNELKRLCSLTDGNLSRHIDVLQDAGLIEAWRGTDGGRPQTLYRSEEHTSELQSHSDLVCRLLLEKKNHARRRNTVCTAS